MNSSLVLFSFPGIPEVIHCGETKSVPSGQRSIATTPVPSKTAQKSRNKDHRFTFQATKQSKVVLLYTTVVLHATSSRQGVALDRILSNVIADLPYLIDAFQRVEYLWLNIRIQFLSFQYLRLGDPALSGRTYIIVH